MSATDVILRIAVVAPIDGLFDYLPPVDSIPQPWLRGLRLRVPFGTTRSIVDLSNCQLNLYTDADESPSIIQGAIEENTRLGFLWETSSTPQCDPTALKAALAWLDTEPLWFQEDLDLLAWTARYYHHPLGEVLVASLPKILRQLPTIKKVRKRKTPHVAVTPLGELVEPRLRQTQPPTLNPDQIKAITTISAAFGQFQTFLLEGVTGSGKTEIYLQLAQQVLANGGQVLILVPEIGLTPQMYVNLNQRLNTHIALLHSNQSDGQREADWLAVRAGIIKVVLGTRLSIFTPMPNLQLIIVDEEHDPSFKQQDGLRYSARDLAVWRARQHHCPVILASATPSLETLHNAAINRYTRLSLPVRAGLAYMPQLDLIDVRATRLKNGLTPTMLRLLKENLASGQQSLLFLNRRGYAPVFMCNQCGWIATCANCDARLTWHRKIELLWCHHCGVRLTPPQICPNCQHTKLKAIGQGTQRVEEGLIELLGDVSIARIDRDTVGKRAGFSQTLTAIQSGQKQILIGTQMLAKGHHFPEVTLVGILDLDQGLYGADFRAAERMAQLIIQAAGRAGRASKPGRMVLQTRHPEHPLLQTLIHHGYSAFANLALQERKNAQLPPFTALAVLGAEDAIVTKVTEFLNAAAALATAVASDVEVLGPAPAIMERRAGRFRFRLLLQAPTRPILQKFLNSYLPKLRQLPDTRRVRWYLDVDPQELL